VIVALCMDNSDELDEYFKGTEPPPFVFGFVGWETEDEVQVERVPHYFLLAADRTLLLHTRSLREDEAAIREILVGM
jgi:hypothetical protein